MIKGRGYREKKGREKGKQKKREKIRNESAKKKKKSKFWLMCMRETKIMYNFQQKLAQN